MIRAALALAFVMLVSIRVDADPAAADKLATLANELASRGKFREAAGKFAEAYAQDPSRPSLYCNIGVSYYKANELPRAHLLLSQCLTRTALQKSFVDLARAVLAQVEDTLRASGHGPLTVTVSPAGTSVMVKELGPETSFLGTRTIWLAIGEHHLVASADGHESVETTVTVTDQTPKTVEVILKPTKPDPGPGPGRTELVAGETGSKVPALVATGVTAVAIGLAVFAFRKAHEYADDSQFAIRQDAFDDDADRVSTWNNVMGVTSGLAIAGAVASTYLWIRATRKPSSRLEVAPTSGGAKVSLSGRF